MNALLAGLGVRCADQAKVGWGPLYAPFKAVHVSAQVSHSLYVRSGCGDSLVARVFD